LCIPGRVYNAEEVHLLEQQMKQLIDNL
jgi:hypothetical protein